MNRLFVVSEGQKNDSRLSVARFYFPIHWRWRASAADDCCYGLNLSDDVDAARWPNNGVNRFMRLNFLLFRIWFCFARSLARTRPAASR